MILIISFLKRSIRIKDISRVHDLGSMGHGTTVRRVPYSDSLLLCSCFCCCISEKFECFLEARDVG